MARIRIALSFEIPEGADRDDCLGYAVEAVQSWKVSLRPAGAYGDDDPGDPMFYLDASSVVGTYATTKNNRRRIVRCSEED